MQLVIDIGNTRIKAALFEKDEIKHSFVFQSLEEVIESDIFQQFTITYCIVGSVVNGMEAFIEKLNQKVNVSIFTTDTPIPIQNNYKSANTLGSDRLAASIGGNTLFPNENVLVIDAGTCIKYNFTNKQNQYIGGAISPGLEMRFKALHTFTARLPLLSVDYGFNDLIGKNSTESILSGVQTAVVAEVDGLIDEYKNKFSDLKIVLTGGDYNFFEKRLKNSIFADPFLILKGLNAILKFNTVNKV